MRIASYDQRRGEEGARAKHAGRNASELELAWEGLAIGGKSEVGTSTSLDGRATECMAGHSKARMKGLAGRLTQYSPSLNGLHDYVDAGEQLAGVR